MVTSPIEVKNQNPPLRKEPFTVLVISAGERPRPCLWRGQLATWQEPYVHSCTFSEFFCNMLSAYLSTFFKVLFRSGLRYSTRQLIVSSQTSRLVDGRARLSIRKSGASKQRMPNRNHKRFKTTIARRFYQERPPAWPRSVA